MIVAFLVFLPFSVVFFFTNFDSVYFRLDLTLFAFRLLNFVIDIPFVHFCEDVSEFYTFFTFEFSNY